MKIQELEAVTGWQPSQSPLWDGDARNWGEPRPPLPRGLKAGGYSVDTGRIILVL